MRVREAAAATVLAGSVLAFTPSAAQADVDDCPAGGHVCLWDNASYGEAHS
jgi:hypothetical protein